MMYNAICKSRIYFIIYVLRFAFEISAAQSIICIIHGKELMMANRPELKEIKWLSLKWGFLRCCPTLLVIWREIYVHMNTQITLACVSALIQTKILSIKSNAEILETIWVIWVRKLYICSTTSWKPTTTASETPCTVNTVILYIIHANHRLHRQLRNLD